MVGRVDVLRGAEIWCAEILDYVPGKESVMLIDAIRNVFMAALTDSEIGPDDVYLDGSPMSQSRIIGATASGRAAVRLAETVLEVL